MLRSFTYLYCQFKMFRSLVRLQKALCRLLFANYLVNIQYCWILPGAYLSREKKKVMLTCSVFYYFFIFMFAAPGDQANHALGAHTRHHDARALGAVIATHALDPGPPASHPAPSHSRPAWPLSSASRRGPRLRRLHVPRALAMLQLRPRAHHLPPPHRSPAPSPIT